MGKHITAIVIFLLLAGISSNSFGRDLEFSMKDLQCTEEGLKILYTIKNERNFIRPNVRIGFKVLVDNKPVGCEVVKINVPVNATPDQTMEVTIPAPCKMTGTSITTALSTTPAR